MEFKKETLQKAADDGSRKVAEAFSRLSGSPVEASVSNVETIPLHESLDRIKPPEDHAIVVYAQLLFGIPGASLLMLPREDALALVDLLNQQPIGTTGVLRDIDRSAIKETLNILSNSYMTALSESANIELGLGVPSMLTSVRLRDIVEMLMKKEANETDIAIIFETTLVITKHEVKASLYLMFNQRLADLIKKG
jgi:chemotaxis protein CheC